MHTESNTIKKREHKVGKGGSANSNAKVKERIIEQKNHKQGGEV